MCRAFRSMPAATDAKVTACFSGTNTGFDEFFPKQIRQNHIL
jgi:hypothetical protein